MLHPQRTWRTLLASLIGLALLLAPGPRAAAADTTPDSLTVMTLNCYAFPSGLTDILKFFKNKDLHEGADLPVAERIRRITQFVREKNPDVVVFQELWNENKHQMADLLRPYFPYLFWSRYHREASPMVLDDGLLIASRRPIFYERAFVFHRLTGDENIPPSLMTGFMRVGADKGALMVGIYGRSGDAVLLVNTHLNSGTGAADVISKKVQVQQIALEIEHLRNIDPRFNPSHCRTIVAGDFNEPILVRDEYRANGAKPVRRVVDRSGWIGRTFLRLGVDVFNYHTLKTVEQSSRPSEEIYIEELRMRAANWTGDGHPLYNIEGEIPGDIEAEEPYEVIQNRYIESGLTEATRPKFYYSMIPPELQGTYGPEGGAIHPFNQAIMGRLTDMDPQYSYFPLASDPRGVQLIDQFFVDDRYGGDFTVSNLQVFRREILGDTGVPNRLKDGKTAIYMDPATALSDHAAVMATFTALPRFGTTVR